MRLFGRYFGDPNAPPSERKLRRKAWVARFPQDYYSQTQRPLVNLVFLLPFLVIYELGVLFLSDGDPDSVRNGADFWMRSGLSEAGAVGKFLLPGILIIGLFSWHLVGRYPWKVSRETLRGMFGESLLFALLLVIFGQLQELLFKKLPSEILVNIASGKMAEVVSYVGAGVYEEFLFRLCLLPVILRLLLIGMAPRWAAFMAILISSVLFSLAHYAGPMGDSFTIFSFTFRTCAGVFFCTLFLLRGFGITVGCHAAYDVFVGLLLIPPT